MTDHDDDETTTLVPPATHPAVIHGRQVAKLMTYCGQRILNLPPDHEATMSSLKVTCHACAAVMLGKGIQGVTLTDSPDDEQMADRPAASPAAPSEPSAPGMAPLPMFGITASYNWALDEPVVMFRVGETTYPLAPNSATQMGLSLIKLAENAIQDRMLLHVLTEAVKMDPETASQVASQLRKQASAEAGAMFKTDGRRATDGHEPS